MADTCPICHGAGDIRDGKGWRTCSCILHARILREIPKDIHGGEVALPAAVRKTDPWSITEDHFEEGNCEDESSWLRFRLQVQWGLTAHLEQTGYLPSMVLLTVADLREIEFNWHPDYPTTGALIRGPRAPDVIVLLGIFADKFYEHKGSDWSDSIVKTFLRRLKVHRKAVWALGLPAKFVRVPLFDSDQLEVAAAEPQKQIETPKQKTLPPASEEDLPDVVGNPRVLKMDSNKQLRARQMQSKRFGASTLSKGK